MRYIEFEESNNIITVTNGVEILSIPVKIDAEVGSGVYCIALNKEEIEQVNKDGVIYIKQPLLGDTSVSIIWESLLKSDAIGDSDIIDDSDYEDYVNLN